MYTKVTIDNFRCFEHLEVGPLARVNLITGANNVGKTALLEALLLGLRPSETELGLELGLMRGLPAWSRDAGTHLGALFSGFDTEREIAIEILDGDREDAARRMTLSLRQGEPGQYPDWRLNSTLIIAAEATSYHADIQGGIREAPGRIALYSTDAIYIPTASQFTVKDIADRFGKAQLAGAVRRIVEAARCIEPRLHGLAMIHRGQPILHAELEGRTKPVPVPLLGDGLNRFLALTLAMFEVEHGVLLVDEIENGIYHKAMPDVWRALAHAAREFDVQLLATTHSWECVRAAVEAFRDDFPEDLHLHRLDRLDDGTIKATTYKASTLRNAVDMNVEVR